MSQLLKGSLVTEKLNREMVERVEALHKEGILPTLAILRIGENADDVAYEKGAIKRCEKIGVKVKSVVLEKTVTEKELERTIKNLNENKAVHGILMLRPLPDHLNQEKTMAMVKAEKDVDGSTDLSLAGVFADKKIGFPPCTAQAVMEMLDFYGVELKGKNVVVIGRSLVIGKPVSMMLMKRDATVTMCHSKTVNLVEKAREADVLVVAVGKLNAIGEEFTNPNQVMIDVGINWDEKKGSLSGDVDFDKVKDKVKAITPVPGGIGTVTTSVLVSNVIEVAEKIRCERI